MNYKKHYNLLIERAKTRKLEGYYERHHIIPKCMGGSDCKENLVLLTAREHYVAHQLLVKIYPNNSSILYAARMMTVSSITQARSHNRLYEWLKKKNLSIGKGNKNSQYGTCWVTKVSIQKSRKIKNTELEKYLNEGWLKGRVTRFELTDSEEKAIIQIKNGTSIYRACLDNNLNTSKSTYERLKLLMDSSVHGDKQT